MDGGPTYHFVNPNLNLRLSWAVTKSSQAQFYFIEEEGMLTPNLSTPSTPSQTAPLTAPLTLLLTPPVTPPLLPPPTPPLLTIFKPLLTPARSPTLTSP